MQTVPSLVLYLLSTTSKPCSEHKSYAFCIIGIVGPLGQHLSTCGYGLTLFWAGSTDFRCHVPREQASHCSTGQCAQHSLQVGAGSP